jgi:hypothetical protein
MYRARARSQLVNNCKILKEVGEYFWSASMMAEMGELTLREMEKVFSKVASSRQQRRELGSSSRPVTIEAGPEGNGTVPNTINGTPGYRRLLSEIPQLTKRIDDLQNDPGISDHVNADQEYTIDQPLPADMLDFDIFAMFDPSVDLDGIDACLAGNFDMSFPNAFQ